MLVEGSLGIVVDEGSLVAIAMNCRENEERSVEKFPSCSLLLILLGSLCLKRSKPKPK